MPQAGAVAEDWLEAEAPVFEEASLDSAVAGVAPTAAAGAESMSDATGPVAVEREAVAGAERFCAEGALDAAPTVRGGTKRRRETCHHTTAEEYSSNGDAAARGRVRRFRRGEPSTTAATISSICAKQKRCSLRRWRTCVFPLLLLQKKRRTLL